MNIPKSMSCGEGCYGAYVPHFPNCVKPCSRYLRETEGQLLGRGTQSEKEGNINVTKHTNISASTKKNTESSTYSLKTLGSYATSTKYESEKCPKCPGSVT